MLNNLATLLPNGDMPNRTDVVIIGGGIVGATAALCLAEAGVSVVLVEKGFIGGEQSSRNWGWVRRMGRKANDIALAIRAKTIWEGLQERLGETVGYRVAGGSLYPCDTSAELDIQKRWKRDVGDPNGIECHLLSADDVKALLPGIKRPFMGALHTPDDGCAEPFIATTAIARAAQRKGALIFPGCAVKDIMLSGSKTTGVRTEKGDIACDRIVVSAGAWSRKLLAPLGIDFPQLRVHSSVLRTGPVNGAPDICVGASDFAFRKRMDGGFTVARRNANRTFLTPDHFRLFTQFLPIFLNQRKQVQLRVDGTFFEDYRDTRRRAATGISPYENTRTLDPEPYRRILQSGLRNLADAYPIFESAEILECWAGYIESTPDSLPVISPVAGVAGLIIASGFSGNGFATGPAAGEMIAEIVMGKTSTVDPAPYAFKRFERRLPGTT